MPRVAAMDRPLQNDELQPTRRDRVPVIVQPTARWDAHAAQKTGVTLTILAMTATVSSASFSSTLDLGFWTGIFLVIPAILLVTLSLNPGKVLALITLAAAVSGCASDLVFCGITLWQVAATDGASIQDDGIASFAFGISIVAGLTAFPLLIVAALLSGQLLWTRIPVAPSNPRALGRDIERWGLSFVNKVGQQDKHPCTAR